MKRQAVKKLIQCVAIIAAGVLASILFMLAIWYRGKNSEPVTDEQVAAQMQQAEPLVIETPEAATEGSITRMYITAHSTYGTSLSVKSADRQKRRREVMKKQSGIFLQARA